MRLLVDKIPKTKEECPFCISSDKTFHRCIFDLRAYDLDYGCSFQSNSCALSRGKECPYLKEANK